jgi:hypothetical protein
VHTNKPPPKFIWVGFKCMMVHISLIYISFYSVTSTSVLHMVSVALRKCEERKTFQSMNRSKSLEPGGFILLQAVPRFSSREKYP